MCTLRADLLITREINKVCLTYYKAESISKGCLCPSKAVIWQVDILCCPINVAPTNPGG